MPPHHVSVRVDVETMARVDALAPTFSTEWHAATRSDILRALILDALARFEKVSHPGGRPRAPSDEGRKPRRAPRPKR